MQRLNKSAHAPLGTVFFLFLGLAVIPVSLKAAGVKMTLSPRVAAAMDAWDQIAEVLGAGYHQGTEFESVASASADGEPVHSVDQADCERREFACEREIEESAEALPGNCEASAGKVIRPRVTCPKAARRAQIAKGIAVSFAEAATPALAEKNISALESLGATKLETLTRRSLLKNYERQWFWENLEPNAVVRSLPIPPMKLEVLVRMKPPATSIDKTAERKVRAVIEDSRRPGRERARLTGSPSETPDNCDL